MRVLPLGIYSTPVSPVTPPAPVTRKAKAADKPAPGRPGASRPARSASALASHHTQAALDDMKLGG
jgi:hypothetical protein